MDFIPRTITLTKSPNSLEDMAWKLIFVARSITLSIPIFMAWSYLVNRFKEHYKVWSFDASDTLSMYLQDKSRSIIINIVTMFVCVEVLRPSQPNGVMSSAVSLPNHTFTGQA